MRRLLFSCIAFRIVLSGSLLFALCFQSSVCLAAADNPGAAAYVYVGSYALGNADGRQLISGFAVAADGSAQPVPGSPMTGGSILVPTPKYLFGTDEHYIYTYTRQSDGSLLQTSSVDGTQYNLYPWGRDGSFVAGLRLDNTGQSMYTFEWFYDGPNNAILNWTVSAGGELSYLSDDGLPLGATAMGWPLNFAPDDRHAYVSSVCKWDGSVEGVTRLNNGSLEWFEDEAQPPPPLVAGGYVGCSDWVAVSSLGYAAVQWDGSYCCGYNGALMASYVINQDGTLSLVPNSAQVPQVYSWSGFGNSTQVFDPTGKYLAIAGSVTIGDYPPYQSYAAIQVYELQPDGKLASLGEPQHWPPSNTPGFIYAAWDNANHLYAVNSLCGRDYQNCTSALYIFNFSNGVLTPAPGSPHSVAGSAASLALMPGS